MSDHNIQLLQGFFDISSGHGVERFSEVCADDYSHNDPQFPVPNIDDLAQYQEVIGRFFQAIPDLKVVDHDIFAACDGVAARLTFSGRCSRPVVRHQQAGLGQRADHLARGKPKAGLELYSLRLHGHEAAVGHGPRTL